MLIVMELYGLKLSGAAFRDLTTDKFHYLGYKQSIYDTDVWLNPAVKPVEFM